MSAALRHCKICGENITGKPRYRSNQTGDYHCQNCVPSHVQQQLMQAQQLASANPEKEQAQHMKTPAQELAHSDLEKEKAEHMKTQKKLDEMTVKFQNAETHYVAMFAFFQENLDKDQRAKWASRLDQTTEVRAKMRLRWEAKEAAKAAQEAREAAKAAQEAREAAKVAQKRAASGEPTLKRSKPSN